MTTRELTFTVFKNKMTINVPWPENVADAVDHYTERGLMEIISRGLQYFYRKELEDSWKQYKVRVGDEDPLEAIIIDCQMDAERFIPPGELPPTQAELLLQQYEVLSETDKAAIVAHFAPQATNAGEGGSIPLLESNIPPEAFVKAFFNSDKAKQIAIQRGLKAEHERRQAEGE